MGTQTNGNSGPLPSDPIDDPLSLLAEARERTLAIVNGLRDADLDRVLDPVMSPIAWDLGHIAAFEDLWLVHHATGRTLLRDDLAETYDAVASPRAERPHLPWLRSDGAFDYMEAVRERTLEAFASATPPSPEIVELVVRHEHQHAETILQTVNLARVAWTPELPKAPAEPAADQSASGALDFVSIDGGEFLLGASTDGFAYDNERPRHQVKVAPFQIGRTPVLNGDWQEFMDADGYSREDCWTQDGLIWRAQAKPAAPGGWVDGGEWRGGQIGELDPLRPVVHINAHEAEAFANLNGSRLPTEAEWEFAAVMAADQSADPNLDTVGLGTHRLAPADGTEKTPLGMIGNTWEWTASDFTPYPGFRWHPYAEYSEPHFGPQHRVLRGGSWATRSRLATPTFRNWDLSQRRQIFSGVRLAR